MIRFMLGVAVTLVLVPVTAIAQESAGKIKILFLGDNGHHRPVERFRQLQPALAERGIEVVYTDKAEALTPKILYSCHGLLVYANLVSITPEQEKALLDHRSTERQQLSFTQCLEFADRTDEWCAPIVAEVGPTAIGGSSTGIRTSSSTTRLHALRRLFHDCLS